MPAPEEPNLLTEAVRLRNVGTGQVDEIPRAFLLDRTLEEVIKLSEAQQEVLEGLTALYQRQERFAAKTSQQLAEADKKVTWLAAIATAVTGVGLMWAGSHSADAAKRARSTQRALRNMDVATAERLATIDRKLNAIDERNRTAFQAILGGTPAVQTSVRPASGSAHTH